MRRRKLATKLAAAEEALVTARAELDAVHARCDALQQERGERAAAAQIEVELDGLQARIAERDAALAASDQRCIAAKADLASAHKVLADQRDQTARVERERDEHEAALVRTEAKTAELRAEIIERETARAAAEARAAAAEANTAVAQAAWEQLQKELAVATQIGREVVVTLATDLSPAQNGDGRGSKKSRAARIMRTRAVQRGDRARAAKQWQAAARHYRNALRWDGCNPAIWVQYGHALKESGHLTQAEVAYRHAVACDPGLADTHLQLGHVLKLQQRTAAARAAYLRAFALEPAIPHPKEELAALGWSPAHLSRLCEFSEVVGVAELQALRQAADAARDRHDWPNAARLYEQVVAADPAAPDIAVQLGHALKEMGELDRAAEAYYAVLEATPADDDLHLHIGHLEKLRANFTTAATHYQRAAELNPDNADAVRESASLRERVRELHPRTESAAEPESHQLGDDPHQNGGAPDPVMPDDIEFVDARSREIYQQLVANMR